MKLLNWLNESNRWKHIVGGLGVALLAPSIACGAYSVAVVASALEFKDKQWGGKIDIIDWLMTIIGGGIAVLMRWLVFNY